MNLVRPEAVLFDWDNTLVDTWVVIHHALEETFLAMGEEPWTLEETKARVRQSAREAFPRLFGPRAAEASEIFYRAFEGNHLELLRELPGASDMLGAIKQTGCFLGVVSNKQGYLLRREAEHLGWTAFFGGLVGASDATRDKPAVEPVELALSASGAVLGPHVWFVGDTDIDMLCAQNAGCTSVLLRDRPPSEGEFPEARPCSHLRSCHELADQILAY